jgi:hypothetical protein
MTELWKLLESDVERAIGGKITPGSGNGPKHKGDVKNESFLVECKQRTSEGGTDYLTLELDWLIKINNEATDINREPILVLEFGRQKKLWVFRLKFWRMLRSKIKITGRIFKNLETKSLRIRNDNESELSVVHFKNQVPWIIISTDDAIDLLDDYSR